MSRVTDRNGSSGDTPGPSWAPLPVAHLRLAAGLVAAVPGSELRARCGTGAELVVGEHPTADVKPSTMRSIAIETWRRCRWDSENATLPNLGDLRLGGSIDDLGGGVFRVVADSGSEARWLATILSPDELVELLATFNDGQLVTDAVRARVLPDHLLGVALIELTVETSMPFGALDVIAADVAARCYVAELTRALCIASPG